MTEKLQNPFKINELITAVNSLVDSEGSSTQVLYSTTGNNTDGAMTQKATTDELNNCVHKTGNETITGVKTFENAIAGNINGNAATVTNGVYTTGNQTIGGQKTFSSVAYGTASDEINSIVTTLSKSKNANGYVKFGNGLLIQWGLFTYSDDATSTITFPMAFTTTNYCMTFGFYAKTSSYTDFYGPQITNGNKKTTTAKVYHRNANSAYSSDVLWIAIGY